MWGERAAARLSLDAALDTELLIERGWGSRWAVVSPWGLVPSEVFVQSSCYGDLCIFNNVLFFFFIKGQLWW